MSTWETESFRGEVYQSIASIYDMTVPLWERLVRKLSVPFTGGTAKGCAKSNNRIKTTTMSFPTGDASSLLDDKGEHGLEFRRIFWEWPNGKRAKRRKTFDAVTLEGLLLVADRKKWYCGLDSVHMLYTDPTKWLKAVDVEALNYVLRFTQEAMTGLCEAARYTTEVGEKQFQLIDGVQLSEFCTYRLYAENIRNMYRIRYATRKGKVQADGSTTSKYISKKTKIYYIGPLTVIETNKAVHVLTMADVDRLQQMLVSQAMLHLYLATMASGVRAPYLEMKRGVLSELEMLHETMRRLKYSERQVLCKYYKKAMDLYQSYVAGPLSDDRRVDLIDDIRDAPEVFGLFSFVARLRKRGLEVAQESGKIYRILCAPDYDIGESFLKRAKQLAEPNPKGKVIHEAVTLDYDDFSDYHASMLIDAAMRMNGRKGVGKPLAGHAPPAWWDNWIEKGERPRGTAWIHQFDWEGCVTYKHRDPTDPDVWKDSTACEEKWEDVMADREDPKTMPRNMLTRLLRDEDCPMPEDARRDITRAEHVLRAGFKMESHKDVARIFYIGNMSDRIYGSELETNIARVATHVSGYTVGAPIEDIIKRIGRCYAPHVKSAMEVYHISSDYEAWSPGMHGVVQRISHTNWAKLFGDATLVNQRYINEDSYLLLNKRGYKGAVHNSEANYEGLNGKEMTVLHCAFVGYTIYRARKGGLDVPVADFAAFIDDGALTLVLPKDDGDTTFKAFWEYYLETTAFLGFKLDRAKCYLSNRFLIYLNEVYYGGRHIAHGLRAVMRIGTRAAKRAETLPDILASVGAGCRGAAKCGISPVQIWKCCIICHAIEFFIRHGVEYISARAAVFYVYAPRILGGLQAPLGLTLDCNFSGSGATEAMAHVKNYTRYNEEVRTWFVALIRTDVKSASAPAVIRNYRTVTPAGPSILADYLAPEIRLALDGFVTSSFGEHILSYGKVKDDEDLGGTILKHSGAVSATVLSMIEKSLISGVFTGFLRKFDSSSTMNKLLGPTKIRKIEQRIRHDELDHLLTFRKRILIKE